MFLNNNTKLSEFSENFIISEMLAEASTLLLCFLSITVSSAKDTVIVFSEIVMSIVHFVYKIDAKTFSCVTPEVITL